MSWAGGEPMDGPIAREMLLGRIAAELSDLSRQVADIEAALACGGAPAPAARRVVQELDRVRQTQSCLADCLDAVAGSDPAQATVPDAILAGVTLPSVAERLRSGRGFAETRAEHHEHELW